MNHIICCHYLLHLQSFYTLNSYSSISPSIIYAFFPYTHTNLKNMFSINFYSSFPYPYSCSYFDLLINYMEICMSVSHHIMIDIIVLRDLMIYGIDRDRLSLHLGLLLTLLVMLDLVCYIFLLYMNLGYRISLLRKYRE